MSDLKVVGVGQAADEEDELWGWMSDLKIVTVDQDA